MKRTASLSLLFAAVALIHTTANAACVPSNNTRCNVEMGLDLIDGKEDFSYYYLFDGAGVDIYIIDDGIDPVAAQAEFGQRYAEAENFSSALDNTDGSTPHGFNMAKAAAGTILGVASGANIRLLRVNYPDDGSNTSLKAALTWLRDEKIKLDGPNGHLFTQLRKQSVVSISLTTQHDPDVNALVKRVVELGLPVFVSAGNSGLNSGGLGVDACVNNYSPAGEAEAFTVSAGSVGQFGGREYYANYGVCVDGFVYAPPTEFGGTSQATARAAGAAALIWQQHPNLTGGQVIQEMIKRAQTNEIPLQSYDLSANRAVTSVPLATNPAFFGISNKCGGRNTLQWIDSGPATLYYQLEKSADSQFTASQVVYQGLDQAHTVYVSSGSSPTYYRVRGCNYRGCNPIEATNANRPAIWSPPCP